MKTQITDREWDALSAYLDGELNARERARLEARLQASVDLRVALDELRRTRTLLRSAPRIRAPRNFTISAKTAAAWQPLQSTRRLAPVFGMVSAFASFLFVMVFLGEFLLARPMSASFLPAASAPEAEEQTAQQYEALTTEAVPEVAPLDQAAAEEAAATEQPAEVADMTAKAMPSPSLEGGEIPAPAVEAPLSEMAEAVTEPVPTETTLPAPTMTIEGTSLALAPTEAIRAAEGEAVLEEGPADQPSRARSFWSGWRIAELMLVILALGAGIAAIKMRRSGI